MHVAEVDSPRSEVSRPPAEGGREELCARQMRAARSLAR